MVIIRLIKRICIHGWNSFLIFILHEVQLVNQLCHPRVQRRRKKNTFKSLIESRGLKTQKNTTKTSNPNIPKTCTWSEPFSLTSSAPSKLWCDPQPPHSSEQIQQWLSGKNCVVLRGALGDWRKHGVAMEILAGDPKDLSTLSSSQMLQLNSRLPGWGSVWKDCKCNVGRCQELPLRAF